MSALPPYLRYHLKIPDNALTRFAWSVEKRRTNRKGYRRTVAHRVGGPVYHGGRGVNIWAIDGRTYWTEKGYWRAMERWLDE